MGELIIWETQMGGEKQFCQGRFEGVVVNKLDYRAGFSPLINIKCKKDQSIGKKIW